MKKLLIVLTMVFMFVFGACAVQPSKADSGSVGQTNFGTFSNAIETNNIAKLDAHEFVDANTGVHYIVVTSYGYSGNTVSITPRLKADGTLYCSWKGNKK